MALVILIDLIAVCGLFYLAGKKEGLENALPFAAFLIVLVPTDSLIPASFFTLTTHRLIIAVLLVLYAKGGGRSRRVALPLKTLLVLNAIWFLVASANSIVPLMSIKKAISVVGEYSVLYLIYVKTISRPETVRRIMMAIVLGIMVCCLFGAVEAYQNWSILEYFPQVTHHWGDSAIDRGIRIQSTYPHPILYGAALAMAIVTTLYLLSTPSSRSWKILLWVGLALMFLNIYKTGSRGPWIEAMLGCFLLVLFGKRKVRKPIMYIAALSALVLITRPGVLATISGIYENTFATDTSTGTSYAYRSALVEFGSRRLLNDSALRVLWGFGPESFYDLHLIGVVGGKTQPLLSCDNTWVQFLLETGAVGLAIMLMMLLQAVWTSWKQCRRLSAPARYLSLTIFVVFAIWYFQMYSVSMYSWGQDAYTLWIFIALTFAYGRVMKAQAAEACSVSDSGPTTSPFLFGDPINSTPSKEGVLTT